MIEHNIAVYDIAVHDITVSYIAVHSIAVHDIYSYLLSCKVDISTGNMSMHKSHVL